MGHLGPHVVGTRVIVRRLVPGESGPTGGPAFTDVLGVLERWDTHAAVRREDGDLVVFPVALVVSGKPVPPRPSRFSRLPPDTVLRYAEGGFRRLESRDLGDWELRYVGGANPRANSALALGDPDATLDEALGQVSAFYAGHGRPAVVEAVVGSPTERALIERGWAPRPPSEVLVAGVAALARATSTVDTTGILEEATLRKEWLVGNDRAQANFDVVAATLDLPDAVFLSCDVEGRQAARVRANRVDDWVYVADLFVQPDRRRGGLGRVLMAAATEWAAERGATAMVLDADPDNVPAQRLYADLGFERHHAFRCLTAP